LRRFEGYCGLLRAMDADVEGNGDGWRLLKTIEEDVKGKLCGRSFVVRIEND
jgi:hypothetical protein